MTDPNSAADATEDLGPDDPAYVVAVGASAGGLEALEELFSALPDEPGCAFVVIQHLSPDFESLMDELLSRRTNMSILRATDGIRLARNTIYMIPPGKELTVKNRCLRVTDRPTGVLNFPIDIFFRSMAIDLIHRSVAIVLSGTGTDGSRGIREVRDAGGLVLIQDESSAKFSGMPVSAAASGQAHGVLRPSQMPDRLLAHFRHPPDDHQISPDSQRALNDIGALLLEQHALDLAQYKSMTVLRRIERRMPSIGAKTHQDYLEVLRTDAAELANLHRDLLIGVTRFFRDPEAFERLEQFLPGVVQNASTEGVRVWVPGCASGQEAYTLAAMFYDYAERHQLEPSLFKLFATDLNRDSLAVASAGIYPEDLVDSSPDLLRRHFEHRDGLYRVRPTLRRMVVFAPHDVLRDPPFTRIDLISCRNLLIYLTPAAQRRVLTLFHFALRRNGTLFLGPSESLGDLDTEFEPRDVRSKIFRKRRDVRLTDVGRMDRPNPPSVERSRPSDDPVVHTAFHTLLQRYVPPTIMVNERHQVVHVFGDASHYLTVRPGRATLDIESVVHPDLRTPIIAAIHRIKGTRSPISYPSVPLHSDEGSPRISISAELVRDRRLKSDFYLITLQRDARAPAEAPPAMTVDTESQQQFADLQEELRASEERLETTIEELETSNEELQATNEELLSSNEEMQSTNEELQSVNEELYTVNAEHQRKIAELVEVNHDLDHLIKSTNIETLFLDRDLRIRRFTASSAQSFSLLPADVGRPLGHLASNLDYEGILEDATSVLQSARPVVRRVQNKRGEWLSLQVRPYRTSAEIVDGVVLTFADISEQCALELDLARQQGILQVMLEATDRATMVYDSSARMVYANESAIAATSDGSFGQNDADRLRSEVESTVQSGQRRRATWGQDSHTVRATLTPAHDEDGTVLAVVCAIDADRSAADVTADFESVVHSTAASGALDAAPSGRTTAPRTNSSPAIVSGTDPAPGGTA